MRNRLDVLTLPFGNQCKSGHILWFCKRPSFVLQETAFGHAIDGLSGGKRPCFAGQEVMR